MDRNSRSYKIQAAPLLIFILTVVNFNCLGQPAIDVLVGTWKIEGKDKYERWAESEDGQLAGESYKIIDGTRHVSETLRIKTDGESVIYEATVPNQNQGNTIPFILNKSYRDGLSFENPNHDFPTQIIYQPKGSDRLFVEVLGADGKGFSYYMDRQ